MKIFKGWKQKAGKNLLYYMLLAVVLVLVAFAVALQPDISLFTGFWK